MPNFRLETNVKKADIKDLDGVLKEISKIVAAHLSKPESYVIVNIVTDVDMIMGGTKDPCASALLMSIGGISDEANAKFAGQIYPYIEEHIGVKQGKTWQFSSCQRCH